MIANVPPDVLAIAGIVVTAVASAALASGALDRFAPEGREAAEAARPQSGSE